MPPIPLYKESPMEEESTNSDFSLQERGELPVGAQASPSCASPLSPLCGRPRLVPRPRKGNLRKLHAVVLLDL